MNVAVLGTLASGSKPWDGVIELECLSLPTITPDTSVISETPVSVEPDSGLTCLSLPTIAPDTGLGYGVVYDANGADTPSNYMTGGTASAETAIEAAANAVDGNTGTQWRSSSSAATAWWKYDLGAGVTKTGRWLSLYTSGTGIWKNFYLQGSNDNSNFTTIDTLQTVDGGWLETPINNDTAYRYYRLRGIDKWRSTSWQPAIQEIEMFEAWDPTGTYTDGEYYTSVIGHTVIANLYVRAGYVFDSWNTQADGGGTSYAPEDMIYPTEPITLYAQWTEEY